MTDFINSTYLSPSKKVITLLLTIAFQVSLWGQVTIGMGAEPNPESLLQLKNTEQTTEGGPNADKGLKLPCVLLTKKTALYPMLENNPQYENQKEEFDLQHIGLIVYNTEENIGELLCKGVNVWNGKEWMCLINETKYTTDCGTLRVHGVYKQNVALDKTKHYISMDITAPLEAKGSLYHLNTNTIDGISFEAKGKLKVGTQTVILEGSGTPQGVNSKNFGIMINSIEPNLQCSARVQMVLPRKRMLVLGNADTYGWVPGKTKVGSYEVLKSQNNFGTLQNSVAKVEDIEIIYPAINGRPTQSQVDIIVNYLKNEKVDICYIGQDLYMDTDNSHLIKLRQTLVDYLEAKGVVVMFWEANPYLNGSAQAFFRDLFQDSSIEQKRVPSSPGAIFAMADNIQDEITTGPFGDVRGKLWGEDASWAMSVSVPQDKVTVYSWGDDITNDNDAETSDKPIGFRHKSLNLVYFGDGGFPSSIFYSATSGNSQTSATICPFNWNPTTMFPTPKPNYGRGSQKYDVYNSTIWSNTMAWALHQAQHHGINTPL